MNELQVKITKYGDRKFWLAYVVIDGKRGQTRSTKAKTKREAERFVAVWEAELREGRYKPASSIGWEEFRQRYESEAMPSMADTTASKVFTTFAFVERFAKPVKLRALTADKLSQWIGDMQGEGRKDTTVAGYIRHLKSALHWAEDIGLLDEVPKMRTPKGAADSGMKGRAIAGEEHERMQAMAGKVVEAAYVPKWAYYLDGLWWSGLRLVESLTLSWEPTSDVSVVLQPGYRPAIKFTVKGHKGRRAELTPAAPEFGEMLLAVPEEKRTGFVFDLQATAKYEQRLTARTVGNIVTRIGKAAGVVVNEQTGKAASAHDYRRAFGTRWAKRVMPPRLKRLMRHKNINTTLKYYEDADVEDLAADLWDAYEKVRNTSHNSPVEIPVFSA